MKVALLIHDINNLGGIITYVERLARGLLEAGHSCEILKLCYQEKVSESRIRNPQYQKGETDISVHPIFGWAFPAKNRVPYKGTALTSAIEKLSSYDLLIWETPAPSMPVNRQERENLEWMSLFQNTARQIITIHDGNLLKLYPQLSYAVSSVKKVSVTAPHPRGYNSSINLGLDQTLIMIPQYPAVDDICYKDKQKGFLACQIFKAWKHMDEPIRAISYMPSVEQSVCKLRSVAGIGLHYYYMTSPDKCKYYHPASARLDLVGQRIWNTALNNGMEYCGVLSFNDRDSLLEKSLLFLDPSWVDDGLGNHLNGAVPEAMRLGCVPVGRPLTFRQSEDDTEAIYQPKRNYLEIPANISDQEYADYLEYAATLPKDKWEEITERNRNILNLHFDYRIVANQLVNQAVQGVDECGAYQYRLGTGKPSEQLNNAAAKVLATFLSNM